MSAQLSILGSGSSGNAAFLKTDDCRILIDAGFSKKRLGEMLEAIGESIDDIDAIFLTHEHSDHASGINTLSRRGDLPVFANAGTAENIRRSLDRQPTWQIFQTGGRFRFRDIEIESFSIPHDAADPVGFIFTVGHEGGLFPQKRIGWLTDLGHIPMGVQERMRPVDVLVIEANYDIALLQADTRRPWPIKQRILGRHGHLSNTTTRDYLSETSSNAHWSHVFLAHLSRDCNSLDAVARDFAPLTSSAPFKLHAIPSGEGAPSLGLA